MLNSHIHKVNNVNIIKLIWSIAINSVIVIFEIIFGIIVGSLALISDAIHNLTDIASMVLSFAGEKISARPANSQKTYGYKKIEAIVAFVNSSILLFIIIFILIEATKRLFVPNDINGLSMLLVAGVAFIGNSLATLILKTKEKNLNMKSAWLHSLQDALFSLAVIIASILIYYLHWNIIDPLISIIISLFLIKGTYSIIKKSINMLLDSVPCDINFSEVKNVLLENKIILEVNDLHIWQTNSVDNLLSAHLIIKDNENKFKILQEVKEKLCHKFKITHVTFQIISATEAKILQICNHCN